VQAARLFALALVAALIAGIAIERQVEEEDGPNTLVIAAIAGGDVERAGDLSRFNYVTLNAWYHHLIPDLKRQNPEIKVLVYKDMASTRSYACRGGQDDAQLPAGVGYCVADSRHPDWFAIDESGNRIEWAPYPGHWQMKVGDPDYQDAWVDNVLRELRSNGWDGVVIDNAMVEPGPFYFPSQTMRDYPTAAVYSEATRSFLARVGPRLKAEGFLVIPNIQAHATLAGVEVWRDWLRFTSGGTREYWMRSDRPGSHFGGRAWLELQQIFAEVQRQGKLFLTGTPSDGPGDVRSMRWGRASFLLGWNGGPAGFGAGDWNPEWTIEVGTPTGPRYQVGSVWRRDFTGGTALANISASASQTVALGSTYLHPDGLQVSSITLAPLTGLVLRGRGEGEIAAKGLTRRSDRANVHESAVQD
jgi:hypothetical protein